MSINIPTTAITKITDAYVTLSQLIESGISAYNSASALTINGIISSGLNLSSGLAAAGAGLVAFASESSRTPAAYQAHLAAQLPAIAGLSLGMDYLASISNILVLYDQKAATSDDVLKSALQKEIDLNWQKLIFQSYFAALAFTFPVTGGIVAASVAFTLAGHLFDVMIKGDQAPIIKAISPLINYLRDPLVLDLDGDGVEVTNLSGSTVAFDFGGDGFAERTGWVSPDDGFLVIDKNQNDSVDSASELFGSPSQDGFEVLETLDTNGDARIDAQDEEFTKLRVWRDLDGDGASDAGELQTLADAGIVAIELTREAINGTNNGNGVGFQANFVWDDDTTGIAQSIYFDTDPQETADPTPEFAFADGVEKLPFLPRSGQLLNLAYVLSTDAVFRADWTALSDSADTMSPEELRAEFEDLLLRWAGVNTVDVHGRGAYVDGRHLAFVEKVFGEGYREIALGTEARTFPGSSAAALRLKQASLIL